MKLSLWQQFSSNHSASFRLVGQFESEVAAQQATRKLESMLNELDIWWQAIDLNNRETIYLELLEKRSWPPPEMEWQTAYNLKQSYLLLDWWVEHHSSKDFVRTIRDLLILDPGSTWSDPEMFVEILEQWGGKIHYESSALENHLFLRLDCTLRDAFTASTLWQQIEQTTNNVGKHAIRVPNLRYTYGYAELEGNTICFRDVTLQPDFFLEGWSTNTSFQTQFETLLKFVESFQPLVIAYKFYQTEPYPFDIPEEPK